MDALSGQAFDGHYFDQTNEHLSLNIYRRLTPHQIRLLTIKPLCENSSEEVECVLKEVSFSSQPSYRALSYVWGSKSRPGTIRINGQPYLVTQNLLAALQQFRKGGDNEDLWIDALCINQCDDTERELQVQLMTHIYTAAAMVFFWLGPPADDSDLAIQIINDGSKHKFDQNWIRALLENTQLHGKDPVFDAVMQIFFRECWNRLWIVQEIACAARVVVCCGDAKVAYEDIVSFTEKLIRHDMVDGKLMQSWAGRIIRLFLRQLGPACLKPVGSARFPDVYEDPVFMLARNAATKRCHNPRDRIYACLGLFEPSIRQKITVEYGVGPDEVIIKATLALIECTGNLNLLLLRHRHADTSGLDAWEANMPSWTPVLDDHWGKHEIFFDFLDPRYKVLACGNKKAIIDFDNNARTLRVRGVVVGIINMVQERNYHFSEYMYGQLKDQIELVKHMFQFREWLGNRVHSQAELIAFWSTLFEGFFSQHVVFEAPRSQKPGTEVWKTTDATRASIINFGVELQNMYQQIQARSGIFGGIQSLLGISVFNSRQIAFIEPIFRHFDYRTFFSFERALPDVVIAPQVMDGDTLRAIDIGVGPASAKEGDVLCVLYGCKLPIILRPYGEYYKVIGDACLSHFMHGEALNGRTEGVGEPRDFILI